MGKEFNNIEDLFKASFNGHKVEPSEKVWNNISFRLKFNKFITSKLFVGSLLMGTVALILFLSYNGSDEKNEYQIKNISINKSPVINESSTELQPVTIGVQKNVISENSKSIQLVEKTANINDAEPIYRRREDLAPAIVSKGIKIQSMNVADSINLESTPTPAPIFSVESTDGCVPFELKISNMSKSSLAFEWDFGDGHKSKEASPKYTYRYPGVYRVELKAIGLGGVAVSFIDSIVVHEAPIARIDWPYESEIQTGQKVIISNESANVSYAQWSFGDKCVSNSIIGKHVFEKEGEYSIMLKVWSVNNCSDSAIINNVKVVNSDDKIVLPNAFTPNLDGPASGYYGKDNYNDVFHPKTNATIEDYEIRIYSKAGVAVFKSTEFSYGWNGYYQNRLLPEGVYLYIVYGKFEGGKKFYKKGNVTILHKR